METKTCPYCRTVNEAHAIVCVNCSARIGEPPQPTQGVPAASDDGGFIPAPPPPPPSDAAGTSPGVSMPAAQAPAPAKRSNTMLLLAVAAAVVVVGVAVVLFLVRGGGGGSLPSELNGHQRADSELSRQLEDVFDSFEVAGMSFDVALYGEGEPTAMLMLIQGLPDEVTDVPSDVFFESFATSFAQQQGLGLDLGNPVQASSGGADFICVDAPAEAFGGAGFGAFGGAQGGAFCVFKGETVGMIFLFDGTGASAAMVAAQTAYDELA